MTRTRDTTVSLEDRVNFANHFPNAIFVSIHFNWSGVAEGLESYALAPGRRAVERGQRKSCLHRRCPDCVLETAWTKIISTLTAAIHATVLSHLSMFDRGVKHARFPCSAKRSDSRGLGRMRFFEQQRRRPSHRHDPVPSGCRCRNRPGHPELRCRGQLSGRRSDIRQRPQKSLPAHSHAITEPLADYAPDADTAVNPSFQSAAETEKCERG